MGVSVRAAGGVVLCVLLLLPRPTDGAPVLPGSVGCMSDAPSCLVVVDPVSATLTGEFTFDNDVALFQFVLGPGTFTFTAASTTAAVGIDPILALFGPAGTLVTYPVDGVPASAIGFGDVFGDDAKLPVLTLVGAGPYTLAVSQFGPEFGNFPIALSGGSLADGFEFDLLERCFFNVTDPTAPCGAGDAGLFGGNGQSGAFSIDLTLTPADTAPIPEPGTLSLVALGSAGAAFVRRRRRQHPNTR